MKFFQVIKLIVTLSLISFMMSARYPNRILSLGNKVPTDIPQANYNNMDVYIEIQKARVRVDNGSELFGDIIVSGEYGVEFRVFGPFNLSFPSYMLIPDEYVGFKTILPFAFISNYAETRSGNDLIMNLDFNFQGLVNNIKITGPASGNTLLIAERIRNESSYARNVRSLILTKIDVLTSSIISDNSLVASYSNENYNSDKARVSELNNLIAGLSSDIAKKEAEFLSNKQMFDAANRDASNHRLGFNAASLQFGQCNKEKESLKALKDKLEDYSKEYTDEKELVYFNEQYSRQCKFLMEAEDLALILPKEKIRVFNVIKELVKLRNFDGYTSYFKSDNLYINNMN